MIQFLELKAIKVLISEKLYNELLQHVCANDLEMTMQLGVVNEGDNYRIESYSIPPQWNEGAESKTLDSKFPKWCFEQRQKGIKINGHFHTHPKFAPNPSGFDISYFKDVIKETTTLQARFIMNQAGKMQCDIVDRTNNLLITDHPVTVECECFNLILTSSAIDCEIVDRDNIKYEVSNDLKVITVKSKYITFNNRNELTYTKTLKETYKAVRKQDTDEGIKYSYKNTYTEGNKKGKKDPYTPKYSDTIFEGYTQHELDQFYELGYLEEDQYESLSKRIRDEEEHC